MKPIDYVIVENSSLAVLESEVTSHLRNGYRLHGSPIYSRGDPEHHIHTVWAQAMYRPATDDRLD